MSFTIEELKVMLSTNLRGKSNQEIEFKISLLYYADVKMPDINLNEYPYFTFDVRYPISQLRKLTLPDRVAFFFNKERFAELLTSYSSDIKIDNLQRKQNIQKNIMTMLQLLFPTKFPVIDDVGESNERRKGNGNQFINPFAKTYFSYLKMNSETYTIKKVVWLNDVFNHPLYRKLIQAYFTFIEWRDIELENALKRIKDNTERTTLEKTLDSEINEFYIKNAKEQDKKFLRLKSLTINTYDENSKILGPNMPNEYRNFASIILSKYRRPQRETTNTFLQELINWEDNEKIKQFFEIFERFNNYMRKNIPLDNEENDSVEDNYVNVELNYINTNAVDGPKREIYVMIDLIEGEVNDANVNSIFCPYFGEYLGNSFEFLYRKSQYKSSGKDTINKWSVTQNRMFFSLKNMGFKQQEITGKNMEIVGKPMPNYGTSGNLFASNQPKQKEVDKETANVIFISLIEKNKEIDEALKKYNESPAQSTETKTELLNFLKKDTEYGEKIIEYVKEYSKNLNNQTSALIEKMRITKAEMDPRIVNLTNKYKPDQDAIYKANKQIAKYKLFEVIIKSLIEGEEQKKSLFRGGKKSSNNRVRQKPNYKTRKNKM